MKLSLKSNLLLLFIPCCILILNILFLKDAALFFMSWPDPTYSYLINGLNLASGNLEIGLTGHPGTPVQVFTAIIIRLVFLFRESSSVTDDVMNNPELYLAVCAYVLILLLCTACFWSAKVIFKKTGNMNIALLSEMAIPLSFASITFMRNLMTEPFLILSCMVLSLLCVLLLIETPSLKQWRKYILHFSALTGFMLAAKFSSFPVLLLPLVLLPGIAVKMKYVFLSAVFFLLFTLPIWNKLGELSGFISGIASHTGKYGTGAEGIVEWASFFENILKIFLSEIPFAAFYVLLFIAILFKAKQIFISERNSVHVKMIAGIFMACTAQVLITAKHFSPHYMIPVHYYYLPGLMAVSVLYGIPVTRIIFNKTSGLILASCFAIIIARDIIRFRLFPGMRNPGLHTVELIAKKYSHIPRLIISSTASAFPETAFAQAKAYSGGMQSFYNEWLKRKYPHTYFYNADKTISDWSVEYSMDEIATLHPLLLMYISSRDQGIAALENTIKDFRSLNLPRNAVNIQRTFINKSTGEIIFEITSDTSKLAGTKTLLRHIKCDAENVTADRSQFVSGGYYFANGFSRSGEKKLSGSYSIKLSGENRYGMEIKLKIKRGGSYEASVWRSSSADGVLTASTENSALFYKSNSTAAKRNGEWEQLLLKFRLPDDFPDSLLKIYVWNKGRGEIYFDDLEIKEYKRGLKFNH